MNGAPPAAPLWKRIPGSYLSALVGWITSLVYMLGFMAFTQAIHWSMNVYSPSPSGREVLIQTWSSTKSSFVYIVALVSGVLIFGTWLFVLLPLYLLVPLRSPLWEWPICTICGAISGALIMAVLGVGALPATVSWETYVGFCVGGAVAGGVTCLFGSLTRRCFQK